MPVVKLSDLCKSELKVTTSPMLKNRKSTIKACSIFGSNRDKEMDSQCKKNCSNWHNNILKAQEIKTIKKYDVICNYK